MTSNLSGQQMRVVLFNELDEQSQEDVFWTHKSPFDFMGLPQDVEEGKRVVVGGVHYTIGDTEYPKRGGGYGGAEFEIRFNDGRVVKTRDLWHQGTIPERHRHLYPDNAIFVSGMG